MLERLAPRSPYGWAAYVAVLALAGLLFATFYPPTYEARASFLFPRPYASEISTQSPSLTEFVKPPLGARLLAGSLLIPTVGADPFSVQGIFRSKRCLELAAKVLLPDGYDDRDLQRIDDALDMEVTPSGSLAVRFRWRGREETSAAMAAMVRFVEEEAKRRSREFAEETAVYLQQEVENARRQVDATSKALAESIVEGGEAGLAAVAGRQMAIAMLKAEESLRRLQIETAGAAAGLREAIRGIVIACNQGGEAFSEAGAALQVAVLEAKRQMLAAGDLVQRSAPDAEQLAAQFRAAQKAYLEELNRIEAAAKDRSLAATLDQTAVVVALEQQLDIARQQLQKMTDSAMNAVQMDIDQRVMLGELRIREQALAAVYSQWMLARLAYEKSYRPFELLDPPYVADVPYFPRRGIFTASSAGAGLVLAALMYLLEAARRQADRADTARVTDRP